MRIGRQRANKQQPAAERTAADGLAGSAAGVPPPTDAAGEAGTVGAAGSGAAAGAAGSAARTVAPGAGDVLASASSKAAPAVALPGASQNAPPVAPLDTSKRAPPDRTLSRQYSVRSTEVVDTLDQIELEVAAMEAQLAEADSVLTRYQPGDELNSQLRNDLAQLHGNANKLLATRIDAILTGELVSGRDDARAKRKSLIKTVEKLIDSVEKLVKKFDILKKESATSAMATISVQ